MCKIHWFYPLQNTKTPTKIYLLHMTLNYIWWLGYSSRDLGSVEYLFIGITPRSTLAQSGSTC